MSLELKKSSSWWTLLWFKLLAPLLFPACWQAGLRGSQFVSPAVAFVIIFVIISFMTLAEIKKLVKALGQVVILEEDGQGLAVVPVEHYLNLLQNGRGEEIAVNRLARPSFDEQNLGGFAANGRADDNEAVSEQELLLIEKLNKDIAVLKEEIKKRELEELASETSPEATTLELTELT